MSFAENQELAPVHRVCVSCGTTRRPKPFSLPPTVPLACNSLQHVPPSALPHASNGVMSKELAAGGTRSGCRCTALGVRLQHCAMSPLHVKENLTTPEKLPVEATNKLWPR
ncbi:hypothetical protein GUJ93_ZPchr0012g19282 [Zizania palustris]|uniref:Uncharacterized protein n=1 Tax=Zizania palustris TaxID=103762 RepID=A0A8J6BSP3_ZIZPA|nr:hypothetical protein GUJ93_ZPchr0012g19282 [Zizania palustris]